MNDLQVTTVRGETAQGRIAALLAQCESSFERETLHAIKDRGIRLPDEAQKTLYDGDTPIARVDFFYEPRIAVFIDGSPHHKDYVRAADEDKRRKLKAKGYRIVVIRDLEEDLPALVQRLS